MLMVLPVFFVAMLAYGLSFALVAVSRAGASVPGYQCACAALINPLVMDSHFFEWKTVVYVALLISGWINIAFLVSLVLRWRTGNGLAFRILRTTTLLMIPSCWILFYDGHMYPREGYVLWVAAMVVALFSQDSSSSRLATAG